MLPFKEKFNQDYSQMHYSLKFHMKYLRIETEVFQSTDLSQVKKPVEYVKDFLDYLDEMVSSKLINGV